MAAGCGYPGDNAAETVAASLSLDAQADLLAPVLRFTLPKGVGPFVEADGAREPPRGRRRSIGYGAGYEIVEAIDALIAANYPPADVWAMTPRQIEGSPHAIMSCSRFTKWPDLETTVDPNMLPWMSIPKRPTKCQNLNFRWAKRSVTARVSLKAANPAPVSSRSFAPCPTRGSATRTGLGTSVTGTSVSRVST
jgi:hypothetical protein